MVRIGHRQSSVKQAAGNVRGGGPHDVHQSPGRSIWGVVETYNCVKRTPVTVTGVLQPSAIMRRSSICTHESQCRRR